MTEKIKTIPIWCITCKRVKQHSIGIQTPGDHNICIECETHAGSCNGCQRGNPTEVPETGRFWSEEKEYD